MSNSLLRTSEEWSKELALDVHILEKTGWTSEWQNNQYAWYIEKISRKEFEHRFAQSVVVIPRGIHFIWADAALNGDS